MFTTLALSIALATGLDIAYLALAATAVEDGKDVHVSPSVRELFPEEAAAA